MYKIFAKKNRVSLLIKKFFVKRLSFAKSSGRTFGGNPPGESGANAGKGRAEVQIKNCIYARLLKFLLIYLHISKIISNFAAQNVTSGRT